jgi:hypothetical protein
MSHINVVVTTNISFTPVSGKKETFWNIFVKFWIKYRIPTM